MWYYIQSEPGLWTVGYDGHRGWTTDSDHDSREAAAQRVAFLNGEPDARIDRLTAERDDLAAVLDGFGAEEEPDIWRCYMTEEERQRLEALHPGELRIQEAD